MESEVTSGHYFSVIDYGVFGFMLLVSASIGVYFGYFDKREQTTEEYLLGGRKMKTIPIAISLVARWIKILYWSSFDKVEKFEIKVEKWSNSIEIRTFEQKLLPF